MHMELLLLGVGQSRAGGLMFRSFSLLLALSEVKPKMERTSLSLIFNWILRPSLDYKVRFDLFLETKLPSDFCSPQKTSALFAV